MCRTSITQTCSSRPRARWMVSQYQRVLVSPCHVVSHPSWVWQRVCHRCLVSGALSQFGFDVVGDGKPCNRVPDVGSGSVPRVRPSCALRLQTRHTVDGNAANTASSAANVHPDKRQQQYWACSCKDVSWESLLWHRLLHVICFGGLGTWMLQDDAPLPHSERNVTAVVPITVKVF